MRHINKLTKGIVRTSSLFGGTQGAALIGSVIRTKLVAVWIGEAGVGLFGLFNAAVDLVGAFSTVGIRSSAVRDVACASESGDRRAVARIVSAVRRWGWMLGIAGAFVMLILSPILAETALGDRHLLWPFMFLSLTVLLNSVAESEKAVLQGLRRFGPLARASLWGVVGGCIVSIPAIYVWRLDSVAPVIAIYAVITFVATLCLRADVGRPEPALDTRQTIELGRQFAKLGLFMTLSSGLGWLAGYVFLAFLNSAVGADKMGAYQAGYTIAVRYVSFLLAAFAMEYYPRLASASTRGVRRIEVFMRHEMLLLVAVFLAGSLVLSAGAPLIVALLYSREFVDTVPMVVLAAPSLVLKAASWCGAFVILSKGDGRTYLMCESASIVIGLICNFAGYYLYGIAGIGASYVVWYAVYLCLIVAILRRRYKITAGRKAVMAVVGATLFASALSCGAYLFRYFE